METKKKERTVSFVSSGLNFSRRSKRKKTEGKYRFHGMQMTEKGIRKGSLCWILVKTVQRRKVEGKYRPRECKKRMKTTKRRKKDKKWIENEG